MKETTLKVGQMVKNFEILATPDLPELRAFGVWAVHRETGLEVFHIVNDDRENLFAFAFTTIPEDSTGVAHILEHSVLCGSEGYPLKDPFVILAQGSLQTYLNAWTFPDKTVYPASSTNKQDYFNLMAVYGDAVFRPLLSEWTFMQEAHRLEFLSPEEDQLSIVGVVYNEMKGEYSSIDGYTELWAIRGVLPDTPYAFESGGDPQKIPDLTWEGLRRFHRERYAPGNCRMFLAGNIPTEMQLAFIADKLLPGLAPGRRGPRILPAKRWTEPRAITIPCPGGEDQKGVALLSWLCGDSTDPLESMAFRVLGETLLGHDGSPLTRTLIEAGLGEDLAPATGFEGSLRESLFVVGLRGVPQASEKAVEALILKELGRIALEGFDPLEIEGALFSMEFADQEIRRSGGPWSLVWLQRSLRGWLHGTKPWDCLLFAPVFQELKQRIAAEPGFLEKMIEKHLLKNPHRALIYVKPEPGFLEKQEGELREKLKRKAETLKPEEIRDLREKSAALKERQDAEDSPAALARIPHLSRKDLSAEVESVPRAFASAAGIPVLTHELFTNGIRYVDLAFPLDALAPEDYLWLPLFSKMEGSLGLPGRDYGEASSLLNRTFGGFYCALETGSAVPGASGSAPVPSGIFDITGRDWLLFRLKTLDEKLEPGFDLALQVILESDFSDLRRIRDVLLEAKNDLDASLAPGGHHYATCRSAAGMSRSRAVEELWHGLAQIEFIHQTVHLGTEEIARNLARLRDKISQGGLIANITGSGEGMPEAVRMLASRFGRFGPVRARHPQRSEAFYSLIDPPGIFLSKSLQVGFAGMSLGAAPFRSFDNAAELVLAHRLSTGDLWEALRMKAGAYGAFASADGLERIFSFSTYRDPNPLNSLDSFSRILNSAGTRRDDEETLEKSIIGVYARETRPQTPAERGSRDFRRFLYGVDESHRLKKRRDLLAVSAEDLSRVARTLAEGSRAAPAVILAGKDLAEKAVAHLGLPLRTLPV
ncbi:MAG: insulinase family protein [Spirochaetaceae bacterium]|nr:insulinase family protein [Spirochaetaceae bacterium]